MAVEKITCTICQREVKKEETKEVDGKLICQHHPVELKKGQEKKVED